MAEADVWQFIKQFVVTGGGAAAIAYGLFKWLGQKWIEDRFAQRLEQLRHDNAKDLAELKVKWDTDLQGKLKYQEREFQVIPEAWEKLADAFGVLGWLTSRYQTYADVGVMNDDELEQFLKASELLETQKQQMRIHEGRSRSEYYQFTDLLPPIREGRDCGSRVLRVHEPQLSVHAGRVVREVRQAVRADVQGAHHRQNRA